MCVFLSGRFLFCLLYTSQQKLKTLVPELTTDGANQNEQNAQPDAFQNHL